MEASIERWLSDPTLQKFLILIVAIVFISLILRILQKSLAQYIESSEVRYRTRKFVKFLGFLLIVFIVSVLFSDKLGGMTVALGVAGAGVAFALQEVIASIAGWVAVSFGNFYKVGDRVQLGGIMGDVIDIGVLRTTLMECGQWVKADQYNGRIVRVANSFVFKEPVFNYSADFPFLWDEISIPVKYGSDFRLAEKIFAEVANEIVGGYVKAAKDSWKVMVNKYLIEDAKIEPMVTLQLTDNWIEYSVRYVVDFKKRRLIKNQLFTRILDEFEKTDGRVSIGSTTLHIVETPPIDVRLRNTESKGNI
jgi:small-conductance mechanosensitive channel